MKLSTRATAAALASLSTATAFVAPTTGVCCVRLCERCGFCWDVYDMIARLELLLYVLKSMVGDKHICLASLNALQPTWYSSSGTG